MARKLDLPLENINPGLLEVLELLDQRKRMAVLSVLTDSGDDDELLLLLEGGEVLKPEGAVKEKFRKALGGNPMLLKPLCAKAKDVVARPTPEASAPTYTRYVKAPEDPAVLIRTALDVRLELQGLDTAARAQLLTVLDELGVLPALQKAVTGAGNVKVTRGFHNAVGTGNFRDGVFGVLRATWHDHSRGVLPEVHAEELERVTAKRTQVVPVEATMEA